MRICVKFLIASTLKIAVAGMGSGQPPSEAGFAERLLDSITPIEYLFDENFENRVSRYLADEKSRDSVMLNLWATVHILMAFQPLDDNIFAFIKTKQGELLEIMNVEQKRN